MFGSAVAIVYAVLMQFNIVYTLFFATAIVCGGRGLGWWGASLWQKRQRRRLAGAAAAEPGAWSAEETVPA
jgi:hypothetical protein